MIRGRGNKFRGRDSSRELNSSSRSNNFNRNSFQKNGSRNNSSFRGNSSSRQGNSSIAKKRTNNSKTSKVVVTPHRHEGVYVARSTKGDALVTRNLSVGESVYSEKKIQVQDDDGNKVEYRTWNPFRSKLGATILGGVKHMPIKVGSKVLYLGAANGTTVSHVSDIVGETGLVYAVEFSHRSGRDLTNLAQKRHNIIPIIEDARTPLKYRMLVSMVDVIFADVAQPDQSRICILNASYFLKNDGWFVLCIKANCVDSTAKSEVVYASEVQSLRENDCKPREQITLEPYHRDHAVVIGQYKVSKNLVK